jgi:hypothetical protein
MSTPTAKPPRLARLCKTSCQNAARIISINNGGFLATGNSQRRVTKHLFLGAVVFAAILLQPTNARAGTGNFSGGKFNFCVSVRFNASSAQITRIHQVFEVASQVLGDATDGQHQFGTISIVNNIGASDQAEFWIFPSGARPDAAASGYGFRGKHVNLYYETEFAHPDTYKNAITIVHEFAHLAYNVGDEYRRSDSGPEIAARCPPPSEDSNANLNYCIMDNWNRGARRLSTTYSVNEFCVASNHDPDRDTHQHQKNKESCWETMSHILKKWRLNLPNMLPQDAPVQTQEVNFNESCTAQTQRVILLIDRSGSMTTDNRLVYEWRSSKFKL